MMIYFLLGTITTVGLIRSVIHNKEWWIIIYLTIWLTTLIHLVFKIIWS